MKKAWTEEELSKLKEISKNHTLKELAQLFSRTPDSIRDKTRKLNLHTKGTGRDRKEQNRIYRKAAELGIQETANLEGLSYDTVASICSRVRSRKTKFVTEFDGGLAKKIWWKAFIYAQKQNFSEEEAKDFASFRVLRTLDGNVKSNLMQTIIDYKRMYWGDIRTRGGRKRMLARTFDVQSELVNLDTHGGDFLKFDLPEQKDVGFALHEMMGTIPDLDSRQRAMFLLWARYGYEQGEIAFLFGVSESRISQIITDI